jgi:prolyl-tRNA synthetase
LHRGYDAGWTSVASGHFAFLGQNFAKAFDVQFLTKEGKQEYVWATSWGVSTRLIGALVMAHSDDEGLVLPPKLAPLQVVIVPIFKGEEQLNLIFEKLKPVIATLKAKNISKSLTMMTRSVQVLNLQNTKC